MLYTLDRTERTVGGFRAWITVEDGRIVGLPFVTEPTAEEVDSKVSAVLTLEDEVEQLAGQRISLF